MERGLDFARKFVAALPHGRLLGMNVVAMANGVAELEMPYDTKLIGDPETGVIHGGAVSALMDTCGGLAIFAHPLQAITTATLDLRIDYMRAATPGQTILARAECYHMTHTVAFIRAQAFDDNRDLPVATASGAFSVELMGKRA